MSSTRPSFLPLSTPSLHSRTASATIPVLAKPKPRPQSGHSPRSRLPPVTFPGASQAQTGICSTKRLPLPQSRGSSWPLHKPGWTQPDCGSAGHSPTILPCTWPGVTLPMIGHTREVTLIKILVEAFLPPEAPSFLGRSAFFHQPLTHLSIHHLRIHPLSVCPTSKEESPESERAPARGSTPHAAPPTWRSRRSRPSAQ